VPTSPFDDERVQQVADFLGSLNILTNAVSELLVEHFRDEAGSTLTIPQYKLLRMIRHTDAERISDVAVFLGVSTTAASKAVERLVRRSLLSRAPQAGDRRASRLQLTTEGRELLDRYEAVHHRLLARIFPRSLPQTFAQTATLLDRLSMDILNQPGTAPETCLRCGVYFRDKCLLRRSPLRICHSHLRHADRHRAGPANQGVEHHGHVGGEDGS